MLEQVRSSLQASEEKRNTSISELAAKHQKVEMTCPKWYKNVICGQCIQLKDRKKSCSQPNIWNKLSLMMLIQFSIRIKYSILWTWSILTILSFFIPLKKIESLEAQLSDALAESRKAAETISSLQVQFTCTILNTNCCFIWCLLIYFSSINNHIVFSSKLVSYNL